MRNLESCIGMALSLEFVTTSIIYGSYNMRYIALGKATWCKKAKIFLFFNQHYGLVKFSHKCHCILLRLFVHGLIDLLLKKGRESTNILLILIARGSPLIYWKYFCQLKVVTKLFQFAVRPWELQVVANGSAVTMLSQQVGCWNFTFCTGSKPVSSLIFLEETDKHETENLGNKPLLDCKQSQIFTFLRFFYCL